MKKVLLIAIISLFVHSNLCWAMENDQPTRLRITNNCQQTLWIQNSADAQGIFPAQTVKLNSGESHDYTIPDKGRLEGMRFWPKIGCDELGNNCTLGQSEPPCPPTGCQPPIDSKFEVTWAPMSCSYENPTAECSTWYNASQVDGYTLPFKIIAKGPDVGKNGCVSSDASSLDLNKCPDNEDLSGGKPEYAKFNNVDLRVYDPSDKRKVIGCMAPCKKLNYPAPWGLGQDEFEDPALHMCCPTPEKFKKPTGETLPSCTWKNGCATSGSCNDLSDPLSVLHTQYVQSLHEMAPSVYAFSYDDAQGLHTCTARTKFEIVFCPNVGELTQSSGVMQEPGAANRKVGLYKKGEEQVITGQGEVFVEEVDPSGPQLCPDNKTACEGCQCCPDGTLCPGVTGCRPGLCPKS